MRLPRVGSQYLMGFLDAEKKDLEAGKTYKVTLPPNIPAAVFWSFTLYDNQTRSMLYTPATLHCGQGCKPDDQLIVKNDSTRTHAVTAKENETREVIWHVLNHE
jgi:hypothetical protein